jgi:phage tail-like protein
MAVGERKDPYLSLRFGVEIGQQVIAAFSEVTGLDFETEVEAFREGGVNEYDHQLAGPTRFPSKLVLKRGMTDVDALWSWHQEVTNGLITRKDVSILLMDSAGEEKRRWSFRAALPVKWTGPQLRAGTSEVAIETLELVHRGLVRK